MMEIKIAEKSDLFEILELQKECYLEEAKIYDDYQIPPITQTLESIWADFEKETFFKAVYDKKIIGSVRGLVDNETCKIGRLIVHKEFRNKGLGKKLMSKIESHYNSVGKFELFTGDKSERNLSLYKGLGYSEFKRQRVNEKLELFFLQKANSFEK